LFTLRDEALSMGLGQSAQVVSEHAQLLEEFLASEQKAGRFTPRFKESAKPILVHGHCHQKAFAAVSPALELLRLIPNANPHLIESSCCGMAGSFGYEVEHIEASKQMAELSLLPSIRKQPNALVVADGTSCRHQIADGASREAMHIVRVLEGHLDS
jgi:Fe-S oxidoreductase